MHWFPFSTLIHFAAFIIYLYLAIIIFYYDKKSNINKIASCLIMCFALWSFVKIFSHNINTPKHIVLFIENLFSFSWLLIPLFSLYFFALLTKRESFIKNKTLLIFIIIYCMFFYLQIWAGNVFYEFELTNYGWFRKWKNNILIYSFYIYFILLTSIGLFFLVNQYLQTKNKIQKRILETFVVASIGTFILMLIIEFLEFIFIYFNIEKRLIEDIPNLYVIIFVISFFYLIKKYKFFKITPLHAAEKIIDSINESLVITNSELDIIFINDNAKKIFEDSTQKLIGKPCAILFKNKNDFNILLKNLIKNETIKNFETEFITLENKIIPVLISGSTMKEFDEIACFVFVISDITEFKKAQMILKERYEKLVEIDIMKTNFLSLISHELRTPLTTILGFLSLILGGATGKIPDNLKEYLEIIKSNSHRLLSLINDLLDMSKLEAGTFTISKVNTDLIDLINESINNLKPLYTNKNITISFDTKIDSLKINIDPTRILQVINNIITNAIKFSKKNSKIKILLYKKNIEDLTQIKNLDLYQLKFQNYIIIKIVDDGIGIEPKNLNKIFDKFYQEEDINSRRAQGAGLGLYIAKEIISMHDGFIFAESEGKDKGSTFTILLPVD